MERKQEDNTVFVLQKTIKKFKLKVSDTSIKEFLLAHPYYPSLKSVCDALKKWGIEYYPLKLETAEIMELELPFIAHLNNSGGQLAFVEEINEGKVKYFLLNEKNYLEDFEKFAKKMSGAVVLIQPNQKSREVNFKQMRQNEILGKALLPLGILALILLAAYSFSPNISSSIQFGFIFWGLLLTKIIGLAASLFLVLHEFKIHTSLGDKICGFSSKTDCDEVLFSNTSRLFGWINWVDTGLIYFMSTLIFLLGSVESSSFGILAIISFCSLPYPIFSVYYQFVKLKKWCPFCLVVQLVLISEFLLLFQKFHFLEFSGLDILRLVNSFAIVATIWILFRVYRDKLIDYEHDHYSFLGMKRNPELFRFQLKKDGYTKFSENENSMAFGKPDAPITLTAFLSLYCTPCAEAFKKLKALLDNCPDVKINVIFSVYNDEETRKVINTLYYLHAKKGTDTTLDFLTKWYSLPKQSRKTLYSNEAIPERHNIAQQIGETNKQLFEEHKIGATPTIYVNGHKYPGHYEYSDLEYYIEDIKQVTMESKRQEACVNCN